MQIYMKTTVTGDYGLLAVRSFPKFDANDPKAREYVKELLGSGMAVTMAEGVAFELERKKAALAAAARGVEEAKARKAAVEEKLKLAKEAAKEAEKAVSAYAEEHAEILNAAAEPVE